MCVHIHLWILFDVVCLHVYPYCVCVVSLLLHLLIDVALIKFYFIDILPLCDLKDVERDRFIPCEMAILEYSLVHGIHKSVHHFVDPGE